MTEELFRQRQPVLFCDLGCDVVHGYSTILGAGTGGGHRHVALQAAGGFFGPPAGHCAAQQVAETRFGVGRLHGDQPAFAVGIAEGELRIGGQRFVDRRDVPRW